jgi:hypothetical protein
MVALISSAFKIVDRIYGILGVLAFPSTVAKLTKESLS